MGVQVATITGAANAVSAPLSLPMARQNFEGMGYGLQVNFSGQNAGGAAAGSGTVSVQLTSDPNANPNLTATQQATACWNNHDVLNGLTSDRNNSIVYPCAYVRLIANATVTGTVTLFLTAPDSSNS